MKTVIILSGKKATGKDTSAGFIKRILALRVAKVFNIKPFEEQYTFVEDPTATTTMSYADPLKELCKNCFGLTELQCYGESDERKTNSLIRWSDIGPEFCDTTTGDAAEGEFLTARDILQLVGTNVMRTFYSNVWANAAKVSALNAKTPVVIFTDARFPDEIETFEKLRDAGGIKLITIRLYRNTGQYDKHKSENALNDWDREERFDYGIENNGTLGQLREALTIILREHFDGFLG